MFFTDHRNRLPPMWCYRMSARTCAQKIEHQPVDTGSYDGV